MSEERLILGMALLRLFSKMSPQQATWSKNKGKVSIRMHVKRASRVKFHPQCIQKPHSIMAQHLG
jgi:hypothetical protein